MDIASSAAPQLTYRIAQNPQNPETQVVFESHKVCELLECTNKQTRALELTLSILPEVSVIVHVKAGRKLRSRLRTEDKGPSPEEDLDEEEVNEEEMLKESEETSGVEAHVEL